MNLGSRPAKRKAQGHRVAPRDPVNFAWTQCRLQLPVWLGGGAALAKLAATPLASPRSAQCTIRGPSSAPSSISSARAREADPAVSALYDEKTAKAKELAPLRALGAELRAALAEATTTFLAIADKPALLADQPKTKAAFAARARALDALHAIQAEAMGRLKTEGAPADGTDAHRLLSDALIITVQGIAAGMNNTG